MYIVCAYIHVVTIKGKKAMYFKENKKGYIQKVCVGICDFNLNMNLKFHAGKC